MIAGRLALRSEVAEGSRIRADEMPVRPLFYYPGGGVEGDIAGGSLAGVDGDPVGGTAFAFSPARPNLMVLITFSA